MTTYHDEVELEDFEYDEDSGLYYYPCPCGDQFEISRAELLAGEVCATCPSCSLVVRVIYDREEYQAKYGTAAEERDLEDLEYDKEAEVYSYPCACGDGYQIPKDSLLVGEDDARCPSCALTLKVVYDQEALSSRFEEVLKLPSDKHTLKQSS